MWYLILLTCVGLDCSTASLGREYRTIDECEAAMEVAYKDVEAGQGLMCVYKDESIRTRRKINYRVGLLDRLVAQALKGDT